jgi:hypothetical protein
MVTFFFLLVVLMILVVAAGSWMGGPIRRRVIYERRPTVVERDPTIVEEYIDTPVVDPAARTRRVVRRTRTY